MFLGTLARVSHSLILTVVVDKPAVSPVVLPFTLCFPLAPFNIFMLSLVFCNLTAKSSGMDFFLSIPLRNCLTS